MKPEHAASRSGVAAFFRTNLVLYQAGGARKGHIRRDRGDDDQVNLTGGDSGHFHRAQGLLWPP